MSYDLANEPQGEGPSDYSGPPQVLTCASAMRLVEIPVTPSIMFNEILYDSQDVTVAVDDSRCPDEQFGDSSAILHQI